MIRYILTSLLQLLSGVSIPLYTVHYGSLKVPIVLRYQTQPDSTQMVVDQGWTLQIGEDTVPPTGFSWPRGAVNLVFKEDRIAGFTVTDADSATVYRAAFVVDNRLQKVCFTGRDSTETQELTMEYDSAGLLHRISRSGGGSVEFDFVTEAGRTLKSSVCRKDAENKVIGVSNYTYQLDSLCQTITETVSNRTTVTRKTVRSFANGQIVKKEEYTGDGRLKRCTQYQYTDDEEPRLESVETETSSISYKYTPGQPCPIEVVKNQPDGTSERLVYTYHGTTEAISSLSRWRNGAFVDTTTVVYREFPAVDAPSGKVLRPGAVVYSNPETHQDTCLEYNAYDTLGLRASRAKAINKRSVNQIPIEVFRWKGPDPLDDLMREQRAHEVCAAWPDIAPDPESGTSYLFESSGAYLGKVEAGEPHGRLIADQGLGETPLSGSFSDPKLTPLLIDRYTYVDRVSPAETEAKLNKSGAFDRNHQGFFRGMWFLWRESQFGCRLDFASRPEYDIYPGVLYVTQGGPMGTVVHDNYNFGNYLWGAAAREVGIPQWIALLGSHFHAFFSPYSFGKLDSPDDIFSIRSGYHWDEQ